MKLSEKINFCASFFPCYLYYWFMKNGEPSCAEEGLANHFCKETNSKHLRCCVGYMASVATSQTPLL